MPARRFLLGISLLLATAAHARIISYAPYTNRTAQSAVQSRLNRYFVLIESPGSAQQIPGGAPLPFVPPPSAQARQVVLYDFTGREEPRVVYPPDGSFADIAFAAVRESSAGVPSILIQTSFIPGGITTPLPATSLLLSTDGGRTFKEVSGAALNRVGVSDWVPDFGGPIAANRYSPVRIGNEQNPFVIASGGKVYAISRDGVARVLFTAPPILGMPQAPVLLAGSDATGSQFLVHSNNTLYRVAFTQSEPTTVAQVAGSLEGWITPGGDVYLDIRSDRTRIVFIRAGQPNVLMESGAGALFAIPTFDHTGAWILDRGPSKPTSLYKHQSSDNQLVKQWDDVTAREVEALHAGSSGNKLLIQVHVPRVQADQRLFQDPALAVWTAGNPAPRVYDELFMNEQQNKRFIHVDVEKLEAGEPFVFDSGSLFAGGPVPPPNVSPANPAGGGGDVIQEWGVVRASLKQQLVLPAVGRTPGAYGSFWTTDIIFHNPVDGAQNVELRFVPNGDSVIAASVKTARITLKARQILRVTDALNLFGLETGTGAVFISPELGVNVTSRTYSTGGNGTFGFGMSAIDIYAGAASPRFPVSFSGAFPGSNFRTNLVLTDTSSRGTEAGLIATGSNGVTGLRNVSVLAAPNGQQQFNNLNVSLGLGSNESGALVVQPASGSAIPSVFAIDNRTNDSTYFPPDLPSPFVRTIPVIGHVDGANNAKFRSDLYLYNSATSARSVTLQMTPWDNPTATQTLNLTLVGNEARVIRDVLSSLFGRTGLARLRYNSPGDAAGVRVTTRTYNINEDGGTYGFLMPPLNNFQSGAAGDTLEILGAVADGNFRTNLGLVELAAFPNGAAARAKIDVIDSNGAVAFSFDVNVPSASGTQINDLFGSSLLAPPFLSGPVLIRVTPLSGMLGAYATTTDNRTNDSVYLAANLGTH